MSDVTTQFFDELGRRGREPSLERAIGTLRFDLKDGDRTAHWLVSIKKGDIAVSQQNIAADCVVQTDRTVFDGIAGGATNALSAFLRGALTIEGNPELMVLFRRLFSSPVDASTTKPTGAEAKT